MRDVKYNTSVVATYRLYTPRRDVGESEAKFFSLLPPPSPRSASLASKFPLNDGRGREVASFERDYTTTRLYVYILITFALDDSVVESEVGQLEVILRICQYLRDNI